jgi:hypothetical protein
MLPQASRFKRIACRTGQEGQGNHHDKEMRLRACCCQEKEATFGKPRSRDKLNVVVSSTRPKEQQSLSFYK